eukprot:ctg_572.g258
MGVAAAGYCRRSTGQHGRRLRCAVRSAVVVAWAASGAETPIHAREPSEYAIHAPDAGAQRRCRSRRTVAVGGHGALQHVFRLRAAIRGAAVGAVSPVRVAAARRRLEGPLAAAEQTARPGVAIATGGGRQCSSSSGGVGGRQRRRHQVGAGRGLDAGSAAACLPPAAYVLQQLPSELSPTAAALAWALGTYAFDRYKTRRHIDTAAPAYPTLARPHGCTWAYVESAARAAFLARDLINAPSEHMGPATLEACARVLAEALQGTCRAIVGDALLRDNFPQVHAVGRAAAERHAPRLIELEFAPDTDAATGDQDALSIVLVGKGVTFDSGGLDLKPSSAMRLMKKDMGGAANVLGLALMLRSDAALRRRLHLRVLVPAVENAVSGGAFRPGDVLTARNGMTTEVGNTDAEGRLILADALVYATESAPRLVVDCATLTGAGRVALGTDVPAMFSNDDQVAVELLQAAERTGDALWRLPLHTPYRKLLRSTVADVQNVSDGPYAGCITAALYLNEFVQPTGAGNAAARPAPAWIHIDHMAYATSSAPGRPEGGLEQGIRALHAMISKRYGGGGKE